MKRFKTILKIFFITILSLVLLGIGFTFLFGDKIENCIKDNVEFVEPDDANWIIISTPNDLHHEQVEKWLVKRKNVFCEKPLTLTERTAKGLFSLADFMGVKLYVDDVFKWHNIDLEGNLNFKWRKYGSFNANIIDNLAYHHFYQWVAVEANHECSPDNEYMKEFQSIWTGKAENFPEKMNIREWENKRAFYKQLCAYSCYF